MNALQRIVPVIVFVCLSNFAVGASNQRLAKYTPRSSGAATSWQDNVRAKLFDLLKMDDLVQAKSDIPFNAKELSSADKETYRVREMEINSTPNRRIRIIVTIPISRTMPVPAVV